jgi:hypothetical protein
MHSAMSLMTTTNSGDDTFGLGGDSIAIATVTIPSHLKYKARNVFFDYLLRQHVPVAQISALILPKLQQIHPDNKNEIKKINMEIQGAHKTVRVQKYDKKSGYHCDTLTKMGICPHYNKILELNSNSSHQQIFNNAKILCTLDLRKKSNNKEQMSSPHTPTMFTNTAMN